MELELYHSAMAHLKKIHAESLDAQRRINREFGDLLKLVLDGNQIAAEYLHDVLQTQFQTFAYLCHKSPECGDRRNCNGVKWSGCKLMSPASGAD
jgi:hypothetical protein